MTRMRHPHPGVTGEINIPDEAVAMHRMSGWATEDENPDLFNTDEPPANEGQEDELGDDEPGEQSKRPRRSRPRATSEGSKE